MHPRLVLFDLDGVLLRYDRNARVTRLATLCGVDAVAVQAAMFDSGLEADYDAGKLATGTYLARLGTALGTQVDAARWTDARIAATRADDAAIALLLRVAAGCAVGILTNNGPLLDAALPRIAPALYPVIAGRVLCSATLGAVKPEPRAYALALVALGGEPASTLFIDDNAANVAGARAAGLQAERVNGADELARVLARYRLIATDA